VIQAREFIAMNTEASDASLLEEILARRGWGWIVKTLTVKPGRGGSKLADEIWEEELMSSLIDRCTPLEIAAGFQSMYLASADWYRSGFSEETGNEKIGHLYIASYIFDRAYRELKQHGAWSKPTADDSEGTGPPKAE
jgi:hypothetical protein